MIKVYVHNSEDLIGISCSVWGCDAIMCETDTGRTYHLTHEDYWTEIGEL